MWVLRLLCLTAMRMQVLEEALKEKARAQFQKEPEKQHFFLMNNVHYMATRVRPKVWWSHRRGHSCVGLEARVAGLLSLSIRSS